MAQLFWVGGTAAWDATAGTKWATSSGGGGGHAVPTAADDVVLDANSGAVTVTIQTAAALSRSLNTSAFTGTLIQSQNLSVGDASGGSLIMGAGHVFTYTAGTIKMLSTAVSGNVIDLAGQTVGTFTINGSGGYWKLLSNFQQGATRGFALNQGNLDLNGFSATVGTFGNNNSTTRILTIGTGTLILAGTGNVWDTTVATGFTLTFSAGAKIQITDTSASAKAFIGNTKTYPDIEVMGAASAGIVTFSGAFTAGVMTFHQDASVKFTVSTTYTLTAVPIWVGASGHVITIQSTSAGTPFTISVSTGTVAADWLSLKDSTATGGAAFYAGANSTNVSGNTGWTFSAAPGSGTLFRQSILNGLGAGGPFFGNPI